MTGTRLKELRLKKGLTQTKVMMETGIDQSDYSKMELGKRYPTPDQYKLLSRLFDTSIDYMLYNTNDPRPYPRDPENGDKKD